MRKSPIPRSDKHYKKMSQEEFDERINQILRGPKIRKTSKHKKRRIK